jgi:hypothetical protein
MCLSKVIQFSLKVDRVSKVQQIHSFRAQYDKENLVIGFDFRFARIVSLTCIEIKDYR